MFNITRLLSKNFEKQLQQFLTEKLLGSSTFRFFAQRTHKTIQDVTQNPDQLFKEAQKMNTQRLNTPKSGPSVFSVLKEEASKELKEMNPFSKKDKM